MTDTKPEASIAMPIEEIRNALATVSWNDGGPDSDAASIVIDAIDELERLRDLQAQADVLEKALFRSARVVETNGPCWCLYSVWGVAHSSLCAENRSALTNYRKYKGATE